MPVIGVAVFFTCKREFYKWNSLPYGCGVDLKEFDPEPGANDR